MSLFAELKRRRVHKVAAMYGIAAWIITEVSATVLPALGVPEWSITVIVVVLITGFPIAMALAWVFDIGPEGVVRTEDATPSTPGDSTQQHGSYGVAYTLMLVVGTAALTLLLYQAGLKGYDLIAGERAKSIAVLPFKNLSPNPDNDYFGESMAEELLNLLARIPGMRVASRTSSFAFREDHDIKEVGQALGVNYVLEGSVRWSDDDKIRITAQLIDIEDGFHLWSNNYDRDLQDIFKVQDEISQQIVNALQIKLGADAIQPSSMDVNAPPSGGLEAYQNYLEGRTWLRLRGERGVSKSIDLFQKAIALDPGYGRAKSGLAVAYAVASGYTDMTWDEARPMAQQQAYLALSIDPNLAEAQAVLGLINLTQGNWTDAEADFFNAISLDSDDATSHQWYSLLLLRTGRLETALEEAKKAHRIDPESPIINSHLGEAYLASGDYENALLHFEEAEALGLASSQRSEVAMANLGLGNLERAHSLFEAAFDDLSFEVDPELRQAMLDYIVDADARERVVSALEKTSDQIPAYFLFSIYYFLGDYDRAFEQALEVAATKNALVSYSMMWAPGGAGIRNNPRFAELGDHLRMTTYWQRYGWPDACDDGDIALSCD